MSTLITALAIVAGSYLFLVLFAALVADSLIFRPRTSSYHDSERILKIPAGDGAMLSAVYLPVAGARCTVFYLHGNAEDLGDILPRLEEMQRRGLAVIAYDYRGYGTTPGKPHEAGVYADTAAVFRYAVEKLGVSPAHVLVYGRSVGSGPGLQLAVREPVGGVVLDGAFTSAFRTLTQVRLLPGDRFPNLERMSGLRCPVLVIHGTRDHTVPFSHGRALFAAAPGAKRHLWVEGAGHNDLQDIAGESYWQALLDFAAEVAPR